MPSFNHRFEPATVGGVPVYAAISCLFVTIFLALSVLAYSIHIVFCSILGFFCFASVAATVYFFRMGDEILFQKDIIEAFMERGLATSDVDKGDLK